MKKFAALFCLVLCIMAAGCMKEESVAPFYDAKSLILGSWTNTSGSYITVLEGDELHRYTTGEGFITLDFTPDSVHYAKNLPDTPAFWTGYKLYAQDTASMSLGIDSVGDYRLDKISLNSMRLSRSTGSGAEVLVMKRLYYYHGRNATPID